MPATEVIHVIADSGTNWTAIAGIVSAGVFGLLGGWLTNHLRSSDDRQRDERQFEHERKLKSADDLVGLIDQVETALDALGQVCVSLQNYARAYGTDVRALEPEQADALTQRSEMADAAYQHARAQIASLRMRPHADTELIGMAEQAADTMNQAIRFVRTNVSNHLLARIQQRKPDPEAVNNIAKVPDTIDAGWEAIRAYEKAARTSLDKLLGAPSSA